MVTVRIMSPLAALSRLLTTSSSDNAQTRTYNVVVHGLAFMILFSAFQTASEYSQPILNDLGHGDIGFYSAAVVYGVFAFSNLVSTVVVTKWGPKRSMLMASVSYILFMLSFVFPSPATILLASVVLGFGAAVLWTAQGVFLTKNSTSSDRGRLTGVFWAMLQARLLIGNAIALSSTVGAGRSISSEQAQHFFLVLCIVGAVGALVFFLLRPTPTDGIPAAAERTWSWTLMKTRDMQAVAFFSAFTGFLLTFWSGKVFTIVSGQLQPENTVLPASFQLSAVAGTGFAVGFGEIIGGLMCGWGIDKYGRVRMLYCSAACIAVGLLIIAQQLVTTFWDTEPRSVNASLPWIVFSASLLGLGDSSATTILYGTLGARWPDDSTAAFAAMKLVQSLAAAIAFVYSGHWVLFWQMAVLIFFLLAGVAGMVHVEEKMASQL